MLIACTYFYLRFDVYLAFITFATTALYTLLTMAITDWRTKYRRLCNMLDNKMCAKAVDSLLNFETVKHFHAESFEVDQFRRRMVKFQQAENVSEVALAILKTTQNVIFQVGLLAGSLLCVKRVLVDENMTLGDVVLFLSYNLQLYGPLTALGTHYRAIQRHFVDMEKMLEVLQQEPEIKDIPCANPLTIKGKDVVFVIKDVSFRAPFGATVGIVGPSGSGKSTLTKLLSRLHDPQCGQISIDDQNIKSVQQKSLRTAIGIVPQDTILFNESIAYNIGYSRPAASRKEIMAAARMAQIHDKIMNFPDGYDTKVGERGMRLSGGEKQRIAIARAVLKNPSIMVLDEATSSLDTFTERAIQQTLKKVTRGRTTFVIAHRLQTVVDADIILVVNEGRIVEQGTHAQLMQTTNGFYRAMWLKQQLECAQ
ncbi:Homocysteine S-methyltransferase 1 [Quaeritorhiza haematococci]|nr:Homocysteine S-methyltransferase 1 [Quaeritorhiza haematococci]